MVNHSIEYVNEENGACTNGIEGTWHGIKRNIPVRNYKKDNLNGHLLYFIWKREHYGNLWEAFLHAMATTEVSCVKPEEN